MRSPLLPASPCDVVTLSDVRVRMRTGIEWVGVARAVGLRRHSSPQTQPVTRTSQSETESPSGLWDANPLRPFRKVLSRCCIRSTVRCISEDTWRCAFTSTSIASSSTWSSASVSPRSPLVSSGPTRSLAFRSFSICRII